MAMPRRPYPSDLNNAEWTILAPSLPTARPGGRPRAHPTREIVDAIRYVLRTGCQWRALPHEYPPWQTVYHSFRAWRLDGTWERLKDELREEVRARTGRNRQPSAAILDSQSAKTTEKGGPVDTTGQRS
jgi:transposase